MLVVITVTPELEEPLIDALLGFDDEVVFTSRSVHGHGTNPDHLNLAEQVSGRRRLVQFQVELTESRLEPFRDLLHRVFPDTDLHCLAIPAMRLSD